MPNWCSNQWTLYGPGPNSSLDEAVELMTQKGADGKDEITLQKIAPDPDKDWGTIWEARGGGRVERINSGMVVLHFDTAWEPPESVFHILRAKFPGLEVEATFTEPGEGASGELRPLQPNEGEGERAAPASL